MQSAIKIISGAGPMLRSLPHINGEDLRVPMEFSLLASMFLFNSGMVSGRSVSTTSALKSKWFYRKMKQETTISMLYNLSDNEFAYFRKNNRIIYFGVFSFSVFPICQC